MLSFWSLLPNSRIDYTDCVNTWRTINVIYVLSPLKDYINEHNNNSRVSEAYQFASLYLCTKRTINCINLNKTWDIIIVLVKTKTKWNSIVQHLDRLQTMEHFRLSLIANKMLCFYLTVCERERWLVKWMVSLMSLIWDKINKNTSVGSSWSFSIIYTIQGVSRL